jgi:uncharacterized protein YndB with AHSA1/START domain
MVLLSLNVPVERCLTWLYSINSPKSLGKCVSTNRLESSSMIQEPQIIQCEVIVQAPIQEAWEAWTTNTGACTFFAPKTNIVAAPGGPYEIFFNPGAAPGSRGAEGMTVLAVQAPAFLSFTWNAPPHLSTVRDQFTHVEIRLDPVDEQSTRVLLEHGGWGTGGEWEAAFDYFVRAWGKVVLPRLAWRFENGPVDWDNPPAL